MTDTSSLLPALVDEQQLSTQLDHPRVLVIDLCSQDSFKQGHIPGAVHIAPSQLSCGMKPAPGKLPSIDQLQTLFQSIGLTADTHVVTYDDAGGSWAGRMIWTLDIIGHPHASLLDGGINAWKAAGLPLSEDVTSVQTSDISITVNPDAMIELEEIASLIGNDQFAVWDARTEEEYNGSKVLAARGGHIPGAIHHEWTQLHDARNQGKLLPLDDIQQALDKLGLSKDKTIATHCQTHRRSGLTYFVAKKLLHYPNIKAYPGSWSEWGNHPDTAIDSE